jgi:hypothetical protein
LCDALARERPCSKRLVRILLLSAEPLSCSAAPRSAEFRCYLTAETLRPKGRAEKTTRDSEEDQIR